MAGQEVGSASEGTCCALGGEHVLKYLLLCTPAPALLPSGAVAPYGQPPCRGEAVSTLMAGPPGFWLSSSGRRPRGSGPHKFPFDAAFGCGWGPHLGDPEGHQEGWGLTRLAAPLGREGVPRPPGMGGGSSSDLCSLFAELQ